MTTIPRIEPLWTVGEVAAQRRVHPETVRRWIATGQVEVIRLPPGGTVRIPDRELRRLLGAESS